MEMIRKFFRNDFSFDMIFHSKQESNVVIPIPQHVKIEFFTDSNWLPFVVERNGCHLTNCTIVDNNTLRVHLALSEKNIGIGRIKYLITEYINDVSYPRGIRKSFTPGKTNILLWRGIDAETEVVVNVEMYNMCLSEQSITYKELRALKHAGKLMPGMRYRITDFVTQTAQANTRSAGHQFDIIVTALDERTISEEAFAIQHEGDTYFANSNLKAWKVWYDFDNTKAKYDWATAWVEEKPASWNCGAGLIEELYGSGASTAYNTAFVDDKTKYLYNPSNLSEYLQGKEFWKRELTGSIDSTEGFIFEANDVPVNNGDEEYDDWYWGDVGEMRVKTADGVLVAVLNVYDEYAGDFYDYERDDMGSYCIGFDPNAEWIEDEEVYRFTVEWGLEEWFRYVMGGAIKSYNKVPYTGSKESLVYAFDAILPKSTKAVTEVYSTDTKEIYYYGDDVNEPSTIDTITYTSYTKFKEGDKGVIYRLIDEKGNDFPYDFKNIQFKYNDEWFYTFGVEDNSVSSQFVYNNKSTWSVQKPSKTYCVLNPIILKYANATYKNNFIIGEGSGRIVAEHSFFLNNIEVDQISGTLHTESAFYDNRVSGQVYDTSIKRVFARNTLKNYSCVVTINSDAYGNEFVFNSRKNVRVEITADRLQHCTFYGAGVLKVSDGAGHNTLLTASTIYLGLNGSNVHIVEPNTQSLDNRVEGLDIHIPNKGVTEEILVDISDIPYNAVYRTHIATNSNGEVKKWCDADLVQ